MLVGEIVLWVVKPHLRVEEGVFGHEATYAGCLIILFAANPITSHRGGAHCVFAVLLAAVVAVAMTRGHFGC